jgi:hypothetical protein
MRILYSHPVNAQVQAFYNVKKPELGRLDLEVPATMSFSEIGKLELALRIF